MDQTLLDFEIEPLDISELQDSEDEEENSLNRRSDVGVESDLASSSKRPSGGGSTSSDTSSDETDDQLEINIEDAVFLKIGLPNGKVFTLTAFSHTTIKHIKNTLSEEFQIPYNSIELWEGKELLRIIECDDKDIASFNIIKRNLDIVLSIKDPEVEILKIGSNKSIPSVDIITVIVQSSKSETPIQIVVEIENQIERKFLGGFRCRKSGKEFMHAETQTLNIFKNDKSGCKIKRSRTCQTNEIIHKNQQTSISRYTQTELLSKIVTKIAGIITPSSTSSSSDDENLQYLTSQVVTIQRIWRGWKARQSFGKLISETQTEKCLKELSRYKYNPLVFEVLYQLVEKWRKKCLSHAYATKTEGPSRADFQDILEMQVHLLAVIEKERVKMREKLKKEKEEKLLEESCSPIKWKGYRGMTISMETIKSQRALELKKLYDILSQQNIPTEQRKENLNTVQAALKNHRNENCSEILSLLNREIQLLEMGFGYKEVESLHKRIEKLFINLIREPQSVKTASKENFYLCVQCKKMLPPTSFVIPLKHPNIKLCVSCHWIDNISHKRVDNNPYKLILAELRREEMKRGCYKSLAFIMEVYDTRYLIDQIWHCQSAISQVADLNELRLARWNISQDWAPWNTILLTKTEVKDHNQIAELNKIYGHNFIKNIKVKLLMAQMHFKSLYNLNSC